MRSMLENLLSAYLDFAQSTTGSVAYDGYYGLVRVGDEDEQRNTLDELNLSEDGDLLEPGWYIIRETPDGFIEHDFYGDTKRDKDDAETRFEYLEELYSDVDPDEDEDA